MTEHDKTHQNAWDMPQKTRQLHADSNEGECEGEAESAEGCKTAQKKGMACPVRHPTPKCAYSLQADPLRHHLPSLLSPSHLREAIVDADLLAVEQLAVQSLCS